MSLWNVTSPISPWLRQAFAHLLSAGAASLTAWPIEATLDQMRADLREARYPVEGIVSVEGEPTAGVELVVYRRDAAQWRPVASAISSEQGAFTIELAATNDGYVATATYRPRVVEGESIHLGSSITSAHHLQPSTSPLTFRVARAANRLAPWSLPLETEPQRPFVE